MKKSHFILLCFVASALSAGVILEDRPHPLMLNGKSLGNALTIDGTLAMSVEDLVKAGATLQVQGNRLVAVVTPAPSTRSVKVSDIHVVKMSDVSSHVMMHNGKAYVPLVDVVRAFGVANWVAPMNLPAGQPISLNFAVNGNGVLAVGH